MDKPRVADRLRYAFDNTMSKGTISLVGWLALILAIAILAISLLVWIAGVASEATLPEQLWAYLMLTLSTNPLREAPWFFRLATLGVVLSGIFVMSTLIGVLTAGIQGKLQELRKGRSAVIEAGHTVILGWSPQVYPIISELVVAKANERKPCIVLMGDEDKVEMEGQIRDKVGHTGRTRIVCRRGNPMEMADLQIVSLPTAKSVIILAPEGEDPDSSVLKTMLAITNNRQGRTDPHHIVAEIRDPKNMDAARLVGQDEAELVLAGDLIARITAQTCQQSGLSVVYTELLNFAGDEIYFKAEPGLSGKNFGEALLAYEDSAVIGLLPKGAYPKLNPAVSTPIQDGDQIIAISADDDSVRLSGLSDVAIDEGAIRTAEPPRPAPEDVLLLGWNWRVPFIINELDHYVTPGSTLTVVADFAGGESEIARRCAGIENQAVTFQQGDTTDRRTLDGLAFETYDHVILLPYVDTLDAQQADARTLITLLHLRDIAERLGRPFSIVSEMLDIRNRNLAEISRADDFVVSNRLTSLILSQISENKALGAVFSDLFNPEGSEIYLRPARDYVTLGRPLNFYTVVEAARRRGEVALGYRRHQYANDVAMTYGVVLNPEKSLPVTFGPEDQIIVLAEK
jgi:voltage-gated potassium channel Kch